MLSPGRFNPQYCKREKKNFVSKARKLERIFFKYKFFSSESVKK